MSNTIMKAAIFGFVTGTALGIAKCNMYNWQSWVALFLIIVAREILDSI